MKVRLILTMCLIGHLTIAQVDDDISRYSIGAYGLGFKKYSTYTFAGLLFEVKAKSKNHLTFSTSAQYHHLGPGPGRIIDYFSLTTGLSWDFKFGNFHLSPGLQMGYLYWDKSVEQTRFYTFNGGATLAKFEIYYKMKSISIGARYAYTFAIGNERIIGLTNKPFYNLSGKTTMDYGICLRYHF